MENPSIMSHMSVGTNDFPKAKAFYVAVLETVDAHIIMEHEDAVAFGKKFPEFWVQTPFDNQPATIGNGVHFAFWANSKEQVHHFYDTALKHGATCDGEPGPRPDYGEPYYGCFVRDLDGHKIEAAFWDFELEASLSDN